MRASLISISSAWLLLLSLQNAMVAACNIPSVPLPGLEIGEDCAADAATLGFNINHFALNVNNITGMMDFYGKVLGMRHIFTYHVDADYSITYMGFSQGGRNGTGFQTGEELFFEKQNLDGLLEFLYLTNRSQPLTPSTKTTNTFGHIGLVVPDIKATQKRMEQSGVKILKRVGEDPQMKGAVPNAFGLGGLNDQQKQQALKGIAALGFAEFLIVADPDGNLIEVQPQF